MRRYHFGGTAADGTIESPTMAVIYSHAQLHIEFQDSGGDLVTPTAGEVLFEMSSDGDVWHSLPHGKFDAIRARDPDRLLPTAIGQAELARATMTGITGASTYTVTVQRW